jgi:hypothetical protein
MTTALAPITKTVFHGSFRTGRPECWEAVTRDGQWTFARNEEPGTPWLVYHGSEVEPRAYLGTLRACRAWVAAR